MTKRQKLSFLQFVKDVSRKFRDDEVIGLSAQLAYFFLLSLFPFLIFLVTLLGYLPITTADVFNLVRHYAPDQETMELIEKNLEIVDERHGGLLSFGALFTIWSASNGVNAIIRALNRAYNVNENRSFLVARMMAFILTIAMVFVIIVALLLPVFGKAIGLFIFSHLGLSQTFVFLWNGIRWVLSFFIMVMVFAVLYYFAPNKHLRIKEVYLGAVFATVGWQLVSLAFSFYVNNFGNFSATYGSIGGVIVLMIWFYISAMMVILGGEINAVLRTYQYNTY